MQITCKVNFSTRRIFQKPSKSSCSFKFLLAQLPRNMRRNELEEGGDILCIFYPDEEY